MLREFSRGLHGIYAPDDQRGTIHETPGMLSGRLCLNQRRYEKIEVGWIDVADSNDAQVGGGGGVDGEARAGARQRGEGGAVGALREKDRDLVFVDGEKEQGRRLAVEIGEVRAFKCCVGG
jgi:hypothetical protein